MVIMFWLNVAIILSSIPSLAQGHGYLIDRDLIAKKNGFKFNFRSGSGIIKDQGFHSLGCWKDTWIRAIQPLEKRHELLMDGNYKLREDPLRKCAIAALDNNMKLFAIENGGQCLGDTVITTSYMRYGNAEHCKDDGYGGPWSMQVYGFTGRKLKRRHGGYTQWSVWTKCSNKCGEGTQKRHRTCTNPSPTHSGRNCESLGTAMEERSCENECLGTEDDEESDNPDQAHRSTAKSKKTSDDFDDDDEDDDYDDDDDKDETSNTDHAEVSKPPDNTIDSVDKTKSGDLGLKTTSDTTKPNTKIAHYESDSNGANTAGTTNNQFGNTDVNTEQSGLPNGDKSVLAQPDKSSSDASGISDQPVAPLSQGTTDIQPSSTTVNLDQSKSQPSRSESTKENDALAIPPIPKANNKDTDTGKAPGTTDNQPGSTAESNKPSESDDLPPPDDGKSTKEEFPDGETDDDLDEKTKDSTKQADSTTPSDKTDISSSSKGLPDQEQMKAAQDLLRSRWLSLAKTGQLKPTSTEPSVTAVTSPKPVVDVALKDDGVEDFEDKEMQDKPVKEDKQKTDPKKVDDLTKNAGKQEGQEKNVDAPQLNVKKIDEQVTKNDGKLEVQGGNVEGSQLNGKKVDTHVSDPTTDAGKQNEQEMNEEGSQISGKKTEDKVSEETTDSKTEIEQNNNADVLQKNGKKIEDTVNDHSTDGMNQEGQDAEVDDQEDKTNEKDHEKMEGNETVQKEKMDEQQVNEEKTKGKEDDQPEDGSQVVEHGGKVDEKQMEEDNAKGSEGDQSVKEEEMEDQVEGSNDHEEDDSEMKGTDEKVDGNTMDDSHTKMMAQQIGAKRIKEECVCPKVDLMGKVMPNPKPCPCTTNPSKKASMTESPRLVQDKAVSTEKRFNAQMTKEEYKTGMFHETVSPKIHISPITPLQKPSSDTTLPTTSSTSLAGNAELTTPPPSGGKLPAPKTSPVIGRAPQSASPVPLSKNMRQNDKVVHIKQGKFKPLSKTLSTLGESINKAHAEGELKEGSDALDNDIHNLLKTIGKLKSQVDVLRNDQTGIASKFPSQSEDTSESAGQSSSTSMSQSTNSYENAEQSQSNTNTVEESDSKADPNKETLLKTKTGSRIPLKLRIIGKTANKKLRNPTILRLKLGGQLKSVQNTAQVKPVQNTAQVKPVQNTAQVKPVQNTAQAKPIVPDPTIHQINTVSTSSVNTVLPQTVSTNTKQPQQTGSPTPAKLVQPETQKATTNGDVNLAQSTNVALKQDQQNTQNIVGTKPTTPTNTATEDIPSQGISTPQTQQDTTSSGSQAVAIANLAPAQLTTTAQAAAISATLPTQSAATLYKTKTFLQDTKTTNPAMHPKTTNNVLQQIITTQKAKPLPLRTQVSPITQSGIATGNTRPPFTNTPNPKAPQQGVTTTQKAEVLPQISPITQSGFTSSTVPHTVSANTAGQLSSTNPGVQRKPKKFVAIESQLARDAATQKKPVHKVLSIPDCNINLGFVLDGSASVEGTSRGNFLKMINFVKDVIHEFVKLSQQVHVGTMVYSTNTSVILSFGTKGTEKVVDQILDSVHYPGQGSLTGKAIKEAWNQMFSSVPRGRKSKLLLLTDGPSNDDIKVPSKWVRDNGVEIFVIGLGKGYDENQLAEMASLPSNGHMMFKDYDDLRTSVQEVRNKVCGFTADEVLQIMTSPGYSDGLREINAFRRNFGTNQCILDVVFLLDGSRQVETNGAGNFQREIDFVKKTVKYLPVSRNDVHVGVGLLGDANVMVFPLNEHYVQNSIDFELNHIRYPASSDIQSEELKYARKLMLMKGARDVATRVFVLVTDVSSIDSYQRAIDELRTEGSDVAMLGVGTSLWRQEVKVRSSVQGLVDQVVSLESGDDNEAAKNFAFNMCKLSNAKKRTEIPGQHWTASNKILNKN